MPLALLTTFIALLVTTASYYLPLILLLAAASYYCYLLTFIANASYFSFLEPLSTSYFFSSLLVAPALCLLLLPPTNAFCRVLLRLSTPAHCYRLLLPPITTVRYYYLLLMFVPFASADD